MKRTAFLLYGLIVYVMFLAVLLYVIGFVGNWIVPKSIDTGIAGPIGEAILINVLCLALFAVQHTIMARPAFKAWWTGIIPKPLERSTFVLAANAILVLMVWQWRAMPTVVWQVDAPVGRAVLSILCLLGFAIVVYTSFLIDHFDLFGLRQVWLYFRGREYTHPKFMERSLYRVMRHPLMFGFLIAFWSAPTMTQGRLLFAIVTTAYIFIGIQVEERDLRRILGEDYEAYRRRTPMLLPLGGKRPTTGQNDRAM